MICVVYILAAYALIIMAARYDFKAQEADYLIVPGTKLKNDRETYAMVNRINRAARYLAKYPDCMVIVSGGITPGNSLSQAYVMANLLNERKIRRERIIMEEKASDSVETMHNVKAYFQPEDKVVVCSNDYHILRLKLLAHKNGYKVHDIFAPSMLTELLTQLPIEMVMIIADLFRKNEA